MRVGVKVCGLTRPSEVEAALEAGVDAIGLVLDRGPRRIDWDRARTLLEVMAGAAVERVVVVGDLEDAQLAPLADLGFDLVQAAWSEGLAPTRFGRPVLPAFFEHPEQAERVRRWRAAHPGVAAVGRLAGSVAVDGPGQGGSGRTTNWPRAAELAAEAPLTLAGGLRVENLEAALRTVRPHAVDVCSGVEEAPGRMSSEGMRDFVREVRRWESHD